MNISKGKFVLLIIMSIMGLSSSLVVLYEYDIFHNPPPFCIQNTAIFGAVVNCEIVLSSRYATVFNIPLDVLAAIWFIINIILVICVSFLTLDTARRFLNILFFWRFLGLIIVPYLIFLEFFVLHAICIYCTIMHVAIILDFIIVSYFLFYKENIFKVHGPSE